jgi:hypothetical protein
MQDPGNFVQQVDAAVVQLLEVRPHIWKCGGSDVYKYIYMYDFIFQEMRGTSDGPVNPLQALGSKRRCLVVVPAKSVTVISEQEDDNRVSASGSELQEGLSEVFCHSDTRILPIFSRAPTNTSAAHPPQTY